MENFNINICNAHLPCKMWNAAWFYHKFSHNYSIVSYSGAPAFVGKYNYIVISNNILLNSI